MFTVPLGIMLGANVTFAKFVTANLIPVTIGNTIAGVFLVAMLQSFVYGKLGRK